MLIPPPIFCPPAPGERLRVLDLARFHVPAGGGTRRYIEDKCRYFETVPDVEHCVLVPGEAHGEDRWGSSRVVTLATPRLAWPGGGVWRAPRDIEAFRRAAAEFRPHVIEAADPFFSAWIGRRLADELPARLVGFCHADPADAWAAAAACRAGERAGWAAGRVLTAYSLFSYGRLDALVVPTPARAARWRVLGLRRARCIAPGVDTGRFYPRGPDEAARVRAEWGVPPGARVLLYFGGLARTKRIDWLVRVSAALRADGTDARLVLMGDGEWRERARDWATESGGHVIWRPYQHSVDALAGACAAADVFVHAGRGETSGLGMMEAQACGLPVVAARGGGLDETVLPATGNALAPTHDEAAWVAAIRAALAAGVSPPARTARHALAKARFAWWRTYGPLTDLYRELAGVPPPGRVTGRVRPLGRWS